MYFNKHTAHFAGLFACCRDRSGFPPIGQTLKAVGTNNAFDIGPFSRTWSGEAWAVLPFAIPWFVSGQPSCRWRKFILTSWMKKEKGAINRWSISSCKYLNNILAHMTYLTRIPKCKMIAKTMLAKQWDNGWPSPFFVFLLKTIMMIGS